MKQADYYPLPGELIRHERQVLTFLKGQPYIKENHPQFLSDVDQYLARSKHTKYGLDFFSYLDVYHHPVVKKWKAPARLVIAAIIAGEKSAYKHVSYCFGVCRLRKSKMTILRKFHFDVATLDPSSGIRSQSHPRFHLQYCGKMIPRMAAMGCRDSQLNQLYPWLSEPRLIFWPMSLALLIDLAFHEFPDKYSAVFRATPEWKTIVRKHETLLLRPFFENCIDVMKDNKGEKKTLADALDIC